MGTFQYCTIRFHIEGLNPNVTDGRTDGRQARYITAMLQTFA